MMRSSLNVDGQIGHQNSIEGNTENLGLFQMSTHPNGSQTHPAIAMAGSASPGFVHLVPDRANQTRNTFQNGPTGTQQ